MRRLTALLFGCLLCAGRVASADSIWTDANIVTGLDLSGSIEAREAQIQIDGIALAIRAPQIVAAIQQGNHGRIGFAVFAWADGSYPVLVSWRVIGSSEDAAAASREIAERFQALLGSEALFKLGALTDISGALEYGAALLRNAPFTTNHRTVNIVGNGIDNVGEGPMRIRDRLVGQGITINGVALGYDRTIHDYFRRQVIGGPEAFVLTANDPRALVEVLARKFVIEIVANRDPVRHALR